MATKNDQNNIDFKNRKAVIEQFEAVEKEKNIRGYLVLKNSEFKSDISYCLNVKQDLLFISRSKLKKILLNHAISASNIYESLSKATTIPKSIIYDYRTKRFQFYVTLEAKGYRIAYELNSCPNELKGIKANIVITLFREDRYKKRLDKIKRGDFGYLSLLFEAEEGWTALVTQSSSGVFDAVASASRETNSNFDFILDESGEYVNTQKECGKKH